MGIRINKLFSALIILALTGTSFTSEQNISGNIFPDWADGYLDIHHINTGKGESAFIIMPDGTTMLIDAGATTRPKPRVMDTMPNDDRSPGEWIVRYIEHMIRNLSVVKLNYILLTHFHDDHLGGIAPESKLARNGSYKLSGLTEVGDRIPFDKLLDRGWPDYNYPRPLGGENMRNYRNFISWNVENREAVIERFQPGRNDQLVLINDPRKYPDFEIRNLAMNGVVWTGTGMNTRNHFPALDNLSSTQIPDENMCSIALRISYGNFDYFNGGDLISITNEPWQDVETPVGMVTGPVEVCVSNHHAYYDAMGKEFLKAVRPRVHVIQTWVPSQPSPSTLSRMLSQSIYPGVRDIFATNIREELRIVIGDNLKQLKSQQGHIVIRVNPGGDSFQVYILDDMAESYLVKSVHGPYICN